jgi:hypothetical protein
VTLRSRLSPCRKESGQTRYIRAGVGAEVLNRNGMYKDDLGATNSHYIDCRFQNMLCVSRRVEGTHNLVDVSRWLDHQRFGVCRGPSVQSGLEAHMPEHVKERDNTFELSSNHENVRNKFLRALRKIDWKQDVFLACIIKRIVGTERFNFILQPCRRGWRLKGLTAARDASFQPRKPSAIGP